VAECERGREEEEKKKKKKLIRTRREEVHRIKNVFNILQMSRYN
jgi:hypothetical protein